MRKTFITKLAALLTILQIMVSLRAAADTVSAGARSGGDLSTIPASAPPVPGIDNGSGAASSNDSEDVIKGILSDSSSKPGTPGLVNDIMKAGFANADASANNTASEASPRRQFADLASLAALAVAFCVVIMFIRQLRLRSSLAKYPVTETARPDQNTTKLDQP